MMRIKINEALGGSCQSKKASASSQHGTFSRMINRQIRDIIQVSTNDYDFVANCGTTDEIYAARLLIRKNKTRVTRAVASRLRLGESLVAWHEFI